MAALALTVGCGDDPGVETQVAFQMEGIACDQPGILAYLQVTGVPGICPLEVGEDRTVQGRCAPVPTGAIRDFRLVYYIQVDGEEVQLATATIQVDLREQSSSSVVLDFQPSMLVTSMDDDGDGRVNLVEFCEGTNPRQQD